MLPFHPQIVHLPLALTFVIPFLVIGFAVMIFKNKMNPYSWMIIIGLQAIVVASGYIALDSGEAEEDKVVRIVSKDLVHAHEEAAEIFVGSAVLVLVLSVAAFFLRREIGFPVKLGVAVLGVLSAFLAYRAGHSGGELVYVHGAATVYNEHLLSIPNPSPNPVTKPFEAPIDENESLKPDENDYNGEEMPGDDVIKQED